PAVSLLLDRPAWRNLLHPRSRSLSGSGALSAPRGSRSRRSRDRRVFLPHRPALIGGIATEFAMTRSILVLLRFLAVPVFVLVFPAVGEARVAQSSADGQRAPVVHVLHERHLGEALRHAVIVHQHRGVVLADLRNRLGQARRQVESAALPI